MRRRADPTPFPNCSSQRALLNNNSAESASNSNGNVVPFLRTGSVSVSDTESRRYAAVTPDGMSTTLSENTNNYANASVNELFSNSSLLRMNAVIPPETVSESTSAAGGEEMGVVVADARSHVSVIVEGVSGDGEVCDGGDEAEIKRVPSVHLRRLSYSEMVEQVSCCVCVCVCVYHTPVVTHVHTHTFSGHPSLPRKCHFSQAQY